MKVLDNNETILQIGMKVNAMTREERAARLKELSQHTKDCSDIGLKPDKDIWTEMDILLNILMTENGTDGSEDGNSCDGCDNEFCTLRQE